MDASVLGRIEESKFQSNDMPCQDVWATDEETEKLADLIPLVNMPCFLLTMAFARVHVCACMRV